MITISASQIESISNQQIEKFIKLQVKNVNEKFPEVIHNSSVAFIENHVRKLVNLCFSYEIETDTEIENFINICYHFQQNENDIKSDTNILDILSYPDRKESDKIYHLFNYLNKENELADGSI
jgi:hypothetical protein